jgi:hypothetical protein
MASRQRGRRRGNADGVAATRTASRQRGTSVTRTRTASRERGRDRRNVDGVTANADGVTRTRTASRERGRRHANADGIAATWTASRQRGRRHANADGIAAEAGRTAEGRRRTAQQGRRTGNRRRRSISAGIRITVHSFGFTPLAMTTFAKPRGVGSCQASSLGEAARPPEGRSSNPALRAYCGGNLLRERPAVRVITAHDRRPIGRIRT